MSIYYSVSPESISVSQECSLELNLSYDKPLKTGDIIEFQYPNSWSLVTGPSFSRPFQTDDPANAHYVSVSAEEAEFQISINNQNWYFPAGRARHGRKFTAEVVSGDVKPGERIIIACTNTYAPYIAEISQIHLRINGEEPEALPRVEIKGGEHNFFRVIAPSYAAPGERFSVLISSLDRYENASSTPFNQTVLKDLKDKIIRDHISFTGSIRIPVQLEDEGVGRFVFEDTVSNAVKVQRAGERLFWGDIHIHTKLSHDAQGNNPYKYTKNVSGLDFAGAADHWESLGENGYRLTEEWLERENEPGIFVTIPAYERNPGELRGHHNIYFRDIETLRKYEPVFDAQADNDENSFNKIQATDSNNLMLIPHHTGLAFGNWQPPQKGCAIDWNAVDDRGLRPAIEIYSHHGQSELYSPQHLLAYEWNRMRNPERRANCSVPGPYYAQNYWMNGRKIGVIGSSDEHSGRGGKVHGGIAAVRADELTRDQIFDAILDRKTYATTGERILLEFEVEDLSMGETGRKNIDDKVQVKLKIWGTGKLLRIEILKYNFKKNNRFTPLLSNAPRPESMDAEVFIEDTIEGDCMYYARVTQEPIEWPAMAWTSPVWIDV